LATRPEGRTSIATSAIKEEALRPQLFGKPDLEDADRLCDHVGLGLEELTLTLVKLPPELMDILKRIVECEATNPVLATAPTSDVCLLLAGAGCELARSSYDCVLAAVERDGLSLAFADAPLRADRRVALQAVRQNGRALALVPPELAADREVVLAAVAQNGFALRSAAEGLKKDREALREDFEVVWAAASRELEAFDHAEGRARSDVRLLCHIHALGCASRTRRALAESRLARHCLM